MDRREFFQKTRRNKVEKTRRISSGLNLYNGAWTANEVSHLLKRTMFGAKNSDIEYFLNL